MQRSLLKHKAFPMTGMIRDAVMGKEATIRAIEDLKTKLESGEERWRRKTEHCDKWKLCDNNPGVRPEKAGRP